MAARCRCWCGCERLDRGLDDATSSDLTCMPCCLDRHRVDHDPDDHERIAALERRVARLEKLFDLSRRRSMMASEPDGKDRTEQEARTP